MLQSLTGAPYEPLRTYEERFLAQKTLFLLALSSAKRIGELHALLHRVSHARNWGEVSCSFVPGFVAKTQDPSFLALRFEGFSVPALPTARNNCNGRLICPVRAFRRYLDRTAAHRPRCERLFVAAGCSKKEISKTWLLELMLLGKSHWSPSLLSLNLLLIPKVSILSEQMKFCFSQNTFFLIPTKE